jgi:cytoskeletal protein RodZ
METFGHYLNQQRQLRALSLEEVAKATRVPLEHLRALEEDRLDDLPGDAFAVGYIRNYARCIGLSADEAVLRYQEVRRNRPAPPMPARRKRPLGWIASLAVAVCVLAALAGALLLNR